MSACARILAVRGSCSLPICAQTISVKAPMKCGVALTPSLSVSSSTILPIENHRADLRRCMPTLVKLEKTQLYGGTILLPTPAPLRPPYVRFLVLSQMWWRLRVCKHAPSLLTAHASNQDGQEHPAQDFGIQLTIRDSLQVQDYRTSGLQDYRTTSST